MDLQPVANPSLESVRLQTPRYVPMTPAVAGLMLGQVGDAVIKSTTQNIMGGLVSAFQNPQNSSVKDPFGDIHIAVSKLVGNAVKGQLTEHDSKRNAPPAHQTREFKPPPAMTLMTNQQVKEHQELVRVTRDIISLAETLPAAITEIRQAVTTTKEVARDLNHFVAPVLRAMDSQVPTLVMQPPKETQMAAESDDADEGKSDDPIANMIIPIMKSDAMVKYLDTVRQKSAILTQVSFYINILNESCITPAIVSMP